jgi:flagellar protein FlaI
VSPDEPPPEEDETDDEEPADGETPSREDALETEPAPLDADADPSTSGDEVPASDEGPPEAALEEVDETSEGDEELEEAELVEIGPDDADVASFHEPGVASSPTEPPRTATTESLDIVEEVTPDTEVEAEIGGSRRRAAHADELREHLGLDPEEPITPMPSLEDPDLTVVDRRPIREDLTYVRTVFDEDTSRYTYQVVEPPISETERQALSFLRETLVQTLAIRDEDQEVDWQAHLHEAIQAAIREHGLELSDAATARVHYYIERDLLGYGPIDVMMQDPMVEDLSCDGPGIPMYVFHRDLESIRTNVAVHDEDELDSYVRSLAQRAGRHISIADPMLDATLPDTSRLQATLSREVTTRGSSFTIRRFRADPLTATDLVRLGTLSARMGAWLWLAMEAGSPMIVAGGTASGKTTTLSSVLQFVPPAKKVVTIEDTREFSLVHENWVASLTRSGGAGDQADREIDMYELLRTALRQRPEYLVVGEVRGSEAQTLFQAMATGHATYSTMHADSTKSAVYRLENPPIDIPRMMLQTLDAIVVQGQTRVGGQFVRRVEEITEIVGIDDQTGDVLTNRVYSWESDSDQFRFHGRSDILEQVRRKKNATVAEIEEDWARRARLLEWMVDAGIRHITDVSSVLAAFYADPDRLMDRIGADPVEDATTEPGPQDTPTEEGP